eukprot:578002-Pleurochrysis_carterae.AAC.4
MGSNGIKANAKKVQVLDKTPDYLQTKKQVLRFLGVSKFHRRCIRRIGHLANPLYELLRKKVIKSEWPWKPDAAVETCRYKRAYEAVRKSLRMDAMLAHPDLHDPLAEYVMTDASDVAACAVLTQWQKRQVYNNEDPLRKFQRHWNYVIPAACVARH